MHVYFIQPVAVCVLYSGHSQNPSLTNQCIGSHWVYSKAARPHHTISEPSTPLHRLQWVSSIHHSTCKYHGNDLMEYDWKHRLVLCGFPVAHHSFQ